MSEFQDCIGAFADGEPVDPEVLDRALAAPDGRAYLIDLLVLRRLYGRHSPVVAAAPATAGTPARPTVTRRFLTAAAAVVVAGTLGGYVAGRLSNSHRGSRSPGCVAATAFRCRAHRASADAGDQARAWCRLERAWRRRLRMTRGLCVASFVLAAGIAAPAQEPPAALELRIGVHTQLSSGRFAGFAGDGGIDRFESYAWANESLCLLSASSREPAATPAVGWHFRGAVLKRGNDEFLVEIEWVRLWDQLHAPDGRSEGIDAGHAASW